MEKVTAKNLEKNYTNCRQNVNESRAFDHMSEDSAPEATRSKDVLSSYLGSKRQQDSSCEKTSS